MPDKDRPFDQLAERGLHSGFAHVGRRKGQNIVGRRQSAAVSEELDQRDGFDQASVEVSAAHRCALDSLQGQGKSASVGAVRKRHAEVGDQIIPQQVRPIERGRPFGAGRDQVFLEAFGFR